MFSTAAVIAAILATAFAGPISYQPRDENTFCARRCPDTSKFNYIPGTTYEFDYNIQTQTAMEGADSDKAALTIRATADIEVLSKCDMALRLRDVKVYRSDPSGSMKYADDSGEFRRALERFPLRLSFQDGVVEEVCPAEGETTWALNIKRGLLTAVQNSMDNVRKEQIVKETDVTGECSTDYKVMSQGWYSTNIKKTKDLLGCTDRNGYRSSVHAMAYRVPSEIQSLPLMKSTHECEQELDKNGLLKSALIKETHTFRPFSQKTSGATTKILQNLKYKTQRQGVTTRQDFIGRRAGVIFEHAYGPGNEDQPIRDAETKLGMICSETKEGIRPETPRLFSELVSIVKNMDSQALRTVYQKVKQGAICRDNIERVKEFFLDSLPMATTSASVELMKEILLNKEVSSAKATMWITSLSFIHYPTKEMLEQIKDLLESPDYSKKTMLPISTMINNYCNHRESCSDDYAVTSIISAMEKVIGSGCYVRDSNLESTLLALRALGNAGHLDSLTSTLTSCISRQSNPIEVRVTAIQAYRRLPCSADRSNIVTLYRDDEEDSELRIAAYLAAMQCPTEDILSTVKSTLENERANQVGSFVWSHLTNLMETSSPQKQAIRRILEDQNLNREFDLESLKYSRNYEGSLFLEKFNTGAMAESNVIFSEKSFLPRSAMLNMSVDLFGHSLNLFELGGRVEGLEYLIETYLGPYSYFGGAKKPKTNVKLDHLKGDLYMRMFGNEMFYNHFKGSETLGKTKDVNVLDMLIKMANNEDYSFTQSVIIMDSSMIIPTSSGMPLNLTVNGTATIDLQASGRVDLRQLTTSPSSMMVDGMIKPSGAIQFDGIMSMDAHVTKTGMRVVNTWHSSTALKGRVELSRGKILTAQIDFPEDKMEILDVQTEFFSLHGDEERKQELLKDNKKTMELCTGSRLAKITGVEICNEFQWTNASMKEDAPYFPFTGPFSQSLILYKRDTHSGYNLMAKQSMGKNAIAAQISFNTPGSKIDRSLALDFNFNKKQRDLEMKLESPWKKAELRGSVDYDSDKVGMRGQLVVDGSSDYGVTSEVGIRKAKNIVTYSPRLVIKRPGVKTISMSGQITMDGLKSATADLSLAGVRSDDMTLKGSVLNTMTEKSVKGSLSLAPNEEYSTEIGLVYQNSGKKKAIIKIIPTVLVKTPERQLVTITGSGDYREGKSLKGGLTVDVYDVLDKPITVKCDLKKSSGAKERMSGIVSVTSKLMVAKVVGNVQKKRNTVSTSFTLDYNFPKIRSIKKDKITFSSKYTDRSTPTLWNHDLNVNFEDKRFPEINFITDLGFALGNKHIEADVSLNYGPKTKSTERQIKARGIINYAFDRKAKIDYNLKTFVGPLEIDMNLKGKHVHDRRSIDSSMLLGYGKGKSIDAAVTLKNNGKRAVDLQGEARLAYPGRYLRMKTDLTQAKRDYTHTMTLTVDKEKSTMVTTYRRSKDSIHQITSDVNMHFMKPIQLTAMTDLDLKDFKASAQADYSGELYKASTGYKYNKNPSGNWNLDITYPSRHIIVDVDGGKRGNAYEGTANAKWDADKDQSQRFLLTGKVNLKSPDMFLTSVSMKYPTRDLDFNMKHSGGKQYSTRADFSWEPEKKIQVDTVFNKEDKSLETSLKIRTPFTGYEEFFVRANSDNNDKKYNANTQLSWSGKRNQITSSFSIKKPYSLKSLDVTVSGTSPFKGFRRMNAEIVHKISPAMNTIIKGNMEGKSVKLTLAGENRSNGQTRDVDGSLNMKTNVFKSLKTLSLKVSHKDNLRKFATDALLDIDGEQYNYGFDMNHGSSGWQFQNTGKLSLSSPQHRMVNTWQHRNTAGDMKSTLTSEWGRNQRIFVNLFGNHASDERTKAIGGLTIETPWEPVRKIDLNLDHEHGMGFVRHTSSLKKANEIKGSIAMNYLRSSGQTEGDVTLMSPFSDIKGKANLRYNDYPMTGHGEVQWSPYERLSMDGSFSAPSTENMDGSLRFTSHYDNLRDIMIKASHKRESSDVVSRASLNYGARQSVEFVSHVDIQSLKKFSASVKTPFDDYKSVEGSLEYNGNMKNFDSRATFGVSPILGDFAGVIVWNLDAKMTGKLRIDTPFKDLRYMQVFASSEETNKGRQSRIETEYHPRQTISLDTTYTFGHPLAVDATLKTPFENMEHLSASLKHALRRNSLMNQAEIGYGSDNYGSDLRLKWAKGISGSWVVTTPIEGHETSKASFRHEGEMNDWKSHGEMEYAGKKGEADVEFQHGYKTTGSFVLKTPMEGMEETKASFNKRGPWNNLRGGLTVSYGREKNIEATIQNRLSNRRLDTTVLVKSPFSDDIRFTIDHDGQIENFVTKVSGTVGSRHSINSETTFNWRYPLIDLSSNLGYTVDWMGRNIGLKINKDGYLDDMSAKVTGILDNDQIDATAILKTKDNIEGSFTVNTPFDDYKDVGMSLRHSGNIQRFTTEGALRYMDGKSLEGTITHSQIGLSKIDSTAEIKTPYEGFELTNFRYQHNLGGPKSSQNVALSYGNGRKLTSDVNFRASLFNVDTSAEIKTPFEGFERINVQYRHAIGQHQSSQNAAITYGNGREITSDFSIQTSPDMKLNLDVRTPFARYENSRIVASHEGPLANCRTHMEMEFMETRVNSDSTFEHGRSTRGSVSATTNIAGLESMKASFNKEGDMKNFRSSASASLKESTIETSLVARIADDIKGTFALKTPFRNFRDTEISLDHTGSWSSFSSEGNIRYMDGKTVEGKITVNHNGLRQIELTAQLKTPFPGYEMMAASYEQTLRDRFMKVNSAVTYGYGQRISLDINADATRNIDVNAVFKTPFNGYKMSKLIFTSSGDMSNFNSHAEMEFTETRIAADAVYKGTSGSIDITTNIPGYETMKGTFSMSGTMSDFNASGLLNLRDSTLEADISGSFRNTIQLAVNIKTPFTNFRNIVGSLKQGGNLERFNSEGTLRYMDGKTIEEKIVVSFTGAQQTILAELRTPFVGFESQELEYRYTIRNGKHEGKINILYGRGQKITANIDGMISPRIEMNAVLTTPFANFETSRFVLTHEGPLDSCRSHVEMQMYGKSITGDFDLATGASLRGNLNVRTNIDNIDNLKISVSKEGNLSNLKAAGVITLRDSTAEVTLENMMTSRRLSSKLNVRNPYTEDIVLQLDFNGRPTSFKHKFSATMGSDAALSTETTFRVRIPNIDIKTAFDYKLAGMGQSGKLNIHKEGELDNIKVNLNGDYNGKGGHIDAEFRAIDGIHGDVKVTTPFRYYRNIGMSFDHSGSINRFNSNAMLRYMDRKEITAKLSHSNNGIERIDSNIEINTPIVGYELTKAEIQHTASMNEVNCNAMVQYGRGEKLTAELHGSSSPKYAMDVKITTPFRQYEDLSASASYTKGSGRYTAEGSLNAGNGYKFGAESKVDLSASPITAVARVTLPAERLDFIEISLSHAGELRNFHSTGTIKSPMTGSLTGEATLNYRSPLDMEGSLTLPGDIEVVLQNSKRNDKYSSHAKLAWSARKEITLDSSCLYTNAYGEKQLMTDLSLTTPFDLMKQTAMRYEHRQASGKYNHKIEADYNGESVLDMDVELTRSSKDEGSITMRQPRPMQLTLSGGMIDKNIDGEMFLNWDRDEPQSNIRVQTTVTDRSRSYMLDKDLAVKLIHPSRTIGIVGNLLHSQQQTKSRGEFIWNEDAGQKVFFDVDMKDRSRRYSKMYDGTMKVGSSRRSLQMDGSYSDTGASRTLDGAFHWDADRDNTKQIGVKAVLTPGDSTNKADLSLRLPSIGKDIKIDSELVLNSGRTLFNGKTEVSYSPDTRKTLTLTSRLENTSYGSGNTNYSFMVGVIHPYTDVDIKMSSDVGRSSEKYTGGMDLMYLTARRERKNFALRGEINKLRKQIEIQMQTPMNSMELSGKVEENPFRLRVRNKYDDKTVQADLTLDGSRRMVDFQTNYDLDNPSKVLHMNAKFVNSSAVQAVLYHEVYSRRVSDALIAVRLNTSRLLHTRIHWRPEMVAELQSFLSSEIEQYGGKVTRGMTTVYEAVGQEVTGKYHRITQSVSEELTPFKSLLENEMADIEKQLESVRRDIRRMYRRNDFYVADMGDYFTNAFEAYKDFIDDTKEVFATVNEKMAQYVEEMKTYPITQNYQLLVAEPIRNMKQAVDKLVIDSVELVARLDDELKRLQDNYFHHYNNIQNKITESVSSLKNHPRLVEMSKRASDNIQFYLSSLRQGVQDLKINDKYNRVMDSARETVTSQLSNVMKTEDLKHLLSLSNNAYQEGVWAYKYWQVEENVEKHLRSILDILKEMVEEELQKYKDSVEFLRRSRVTVWDPEHGEVQVELYLPIPLESLDTTPDVNSYVQHVKTEVSKYIPEQRTVQRYYRYIPASIWRSNVTQEATSVQRIQPNRALRRQLRRYNAIQA